MTSSLKSLSSLFVQHRGHLDIVSGDREGSRGFDAEGILVVLYYRACIASVLLDGQGLVRTTYTRLHVIHALLGAPVSWVVFNLPLHSVQVRLPFAVVSGRKRLPCGFCSQR